MTLDWDWAEMSGGAYQASKMAISGIGYAQVRQMQKKLPSHRSMMLAAMIRGVSTEEVGGSGGKGAIGVIGLLGLV